MHEMWHAILAWLAFWSSEPSALEVERARAAGYANVAYAALAEEPVPPPSPAPTPPKPKPAPAPCQSGTCPVKVLR